MAYDKYLNSIHFNTHNVLGYVSTNVLCCAAVGKAKEYECIVREVISPGRKRRRSSSPRDERTNRRIMNVHTPLNINSTNLQIIIQYLKSENKQINIIPRALTFTSLSSANIFKVLKLINPDHLLILGMDFCLQSGEELNQTTQLPILQKLVNIQSLSLTYNFLRGKRVEEKLIWTISSLPRLRKINLNGNLLKATLSLYLTPNLVELHACNIYPNNDSLQSIGEICGESMRVLKLSDNGLVSRMSGFCDMMRHFTALRRLDLAGNQLRSSLDAVKLLDGVLYVRDTLQVRTLI